MTLSKSRKILLLIGTVLPILYMIGFMVMTISLFFLTSHGNEQSWLFKNFGLLFVMHGIVILLMMSILVIYLIYIFKSNMDQQMKILWAIVIFVGGPIGMLVFWFIKIWREDISNVEMKSL